MPDKIYTEDEAEELGAFAEDAIEVTDTVASSDNEEARDG